MSGEKVPYHVRCQECGASLRSTLELPEGVDPADALAGYLCAACSDERDRATVAEREGFRAFVGAATGEEFPVGAVVTPHHATMAAKHVLARIEAAEKKLAHIRRR